MRVDVSPIFAQDVLARIEHLSEAATRLDWTGTIAGLPVFDGLDSGVDLIVAGDVQLSIASFVSGPGATTLPMVVFSSVRLGVSPKINALATLIILAVSLATLLSKMKREARLG